MDMSTLAPPEFARGVEMEIETGPPPGHISLSVKDLERRLNELTDHEDQQERWALAGRGKSVTEIAERLLPFSFLEARNLLSINKDPLLKASLKNWKEKERYFDSRVSSWKHDIEQIKNVVLQVVGFYFVFQGFLLTAITPARGVAGLSQESRLYLVFVSVAASLLTILVITRKFTVIRDLEKTLWREELDLREVLKRRLELARTGERYKFQDRSYKHIPRRHSFFGNYWMDFGAIFVLYQTAWVFPLAVWRISK